MRNLPAPIVAFLVLLLAFASPPAHAADGVLSVGDPAPALVGGKWMKGEPVEKFEKGKIYVVEFWATWCAPCRESIPHLSKLQQEYKKDVIFIGQNCWEEDISNVPPFMQVMGENMNYRVVLDDTSHEPKGAMAAAWMDAAGRRKLPSAFVVDKETKIAWMGRPMELDPVLKAVVEGTFDGKKFAAAQKAREDLKTAIGAAIEAKEFDKALAGVEELARIAPEMAETMAGAKFQLLLAKEDYSAAWEQCKRLQQIYKDNASALGGLALMILDPNGPVKKPDLVQAELAAARAVELTKGENAGYLHVLASVYFAQSKIDRAIETETKALENASDAERQEVSRTLESYKAAKAKQ